MKKTQKTMLTAAILSMAAASANMIPDSASNTKVEANSPVPVYGPPPFYQAIKGDTNANGKIDIADVCMIKSTILDKAYDSICDVNEDLEINYIDYHAVRGYFLGTVHDMSDVKYVPAPETTPVTTVPEELEPIPVVYGPAPAFTTVPDKIQTKYGCFPTTTDKEVE